MERELRCFFFSFILLGFDDHKGAWGIWLKIECTRKQQKQSQSEVILKNINQNNEISVYVFLLLIIIKLRHDSFLQVGTLF